MTTAQLNRMVHHVLTAMFRVGLFDHPTPTPATVLDTNVSTPAHQELSTRIATHGSVLLKNRAARCPCTQLHSVAVIGDAAEEPADHRRRLGHGHAVLADGHPAGRDSRADGGHRVTVTHAQGTLGTDPLTAVPPRRSATA